MLSLFGVFVVGFGVWTSIHIARDLNKGRYWKEGWPFFAGPVALTLIAIIAVIKVNQGL